MQGYSKMAHIAALRRLNIVRNSLVFLRPQVRAMTSEYGSGEGKVCAENTVQKCLENVVQYIVFSYISPVILLAQLTL
jgi:hypothetical protein